MADIFISYSNKDKNRIAHLAEMLSKTGGWSVWWDRDIPTGRPFDEVIEEELVNSGCIVVIWSEESIKSGWVKTEAQEGCDRGRLIPIRIDNVPIPIAFRRFQTANLSSWNGSEADTEFKKLISDIKSILNHQQVPSQSTAGEISIEIPTEIKKEASGAQNTQGPAATQPASINVSYTTTLTEQIKFISLISFGWAISGAIVGVINRAIHGAISVVPDGVIGGLAGVIGGLATGYALKQIEPSIQRKQIDIVTIGWAIAGVIGGIIAGAIGGWAINGVIRGAIGGLATGYALKQIEPSIQRKQIVILTIGWAIAVTIGWAIVVATGLMPINETIAGIVGGAVRGAVGGTVMVWCLKPIR